jgi:hypothetical protein
MSSNSTLGLTGSLNGTSPKPGISAAGTLGILGGLTISTRPPTPAR